jgi:hypothetical protein
MVSGGAASLAALVPARAAASRKNGAKSRGRRTAEGKARAARNALKHGLCAQRFVVLRDENLAAFEALEAALMAELAPQGALQAVLVRGIVAATGGSSGPSAWRPSCGARCAPSRRSRPRLRPTRRHSKRPRSPKCRANPSAAQILTNPQLCPGLRRHS